jgi:hypothetical protein
VFSSPAQKENTFVSFPYLPFVSFPHLSVTQHPLPHISFKPNTGPLCPLVSRLLSPPSQSLTLCLQNTVASRLLPLSVPQSLCCSASRLPLQLTARETRYSLCISIFEIAEKCEFLMIWEMGFVGFGLQLILPSMVMGVIANNPCFDFDFVCSCLCWFLDLTVQLFHFCRVW